MRTWLQLTHLFFCQPFSWQSITFVHAAIPVVWLPNLTLRVAKISS